MAQLQGAWGLVAATLSDLGPGRRRDSERRRPRAPRAGRRRLRGPRPGHGHPELFQVVGEGIETGPGP